jgi:hypothetical protein
MEKAVNRATKGARGLVRLQQVLGRQRLFVDARDKQSGSGYAGVIDPLLLVLTEQAETLGRNSARAIENTQLPVPRSRQPYCHTSVIGNTPALFPKCPSPYISSIVRSARK